MVSFILLMMISSQSLIVEERRVITQGVLLRGIGMALTALPRLPRFYGRQAG